VNESARARESIGRVAYGPTPEEISSLAHRRSLYIALDMKAGESLTPQNLRAIRPGLGLPPKYLKELLGRTVKRDVARGTPASWDLIA
jgi:sialic acid synthase SpsE